MMLQKNCRQPSDISFARGLIISAVFLLTNMFHGRFANKNH